MIQESILHPAEAAGIQSLPLYFRGYTPFCISPVGGILGVAPGFGLIFEKMHGGGDHI